MTSKGHLPLSGVRVLDFGHTVMGPCCGLILADLGAEVIKIEPIDGDRTRSLRGFGIGYFGYFNRNKKSVAIDVKDPRGLALVKRLAADADVLLENFAPGTMERMGLGYDSLRALNPRLIYCDLKGFLPGPYEGRQALDEVVQMMAGLAYMTGPPGQPLRAGASVVDIVAGMFGVIGVLVSLGQRGKGGDGQLVQSALFESTVFLMGQHLSYAAQIEGEVPPMTARVSAWAVYEMFETADGKKIFVGITSDRHWQRFCSLAGLGHLLENPALASNNDRIAARGWLIPILAKHFAGLSLERALRLCEEATIPFAPVARPEDLLTDRHLAETDALLPTSLPRGEKAQLPRLPLALDSERPGLRLEPPLLGEHTAEVLGGIGVGADEIGLLEREHVIAVSRREPTVAGGTE